MIIAKAKTTNVYPNTIINGNKKSLKESPIPFKVFWIKIVAFLNGRIFINVMIPPLNPSVGNHMPDRTDCPVIKIEDTPPIDFSLHKAPNKIPHPIKSNDVTILNRIAKTIPILKIEESIIPPTKKNRTDWTTEIGTTDRAYEIINSYDFALDT